MALIRLNNQSISSVTALPSGVGGKVLNVYNVGYSTETNLSTTAWTDFLSKTLTPTNANSSFVVQFTIHSKDNASGQNSTWGVRLLRDATAVYQPATTYEIQSESVNQAGHTRSSWSIEDSPSTASSITYKAQISVYNNASMTFNRQSYFRSDMTIFEIAG